MQYRTPSFTKQLQLEKKASEALDQICGDRNPFEALAEEIAKFDQPSVATVALRDFQWGKRSTQDKIYSFNYDLAKEHGDTAALILNYVAEQILNRNLRQPDKNCHYETITSLATHFPFINADTIRDQVARLKESGMLKLRKIKQPGRKGTIRYSFRDKSAFDRAANSKIFFSSEDAQDYGVVGAVVLMRLHLYMAEQRVNTQNHVTFPIAFVSRCKNELPYDRSTIQRVLKQLVNYGPITKQKQETSTACAYSLTDETRLLALHKQWQAAQVKKIKPVDIHLLK